MRGMERENKEKIQQEIETFFNFFIEERDKIHSLSSEQYRRILLLSLLDTLAKCAFPKEKGNRKRFTSLIDSYSHWQDKDRVSLIQLKYLLDKSDCEEHLELKKEVNDRISKWPYGRFLRPAECDPLVTDLLKFQSAKNKEMLEKTRYAALLWTIRNIAVHEFRDAGHGMPLSNDNSTPYYHGFDRLRRDGIGYEDGTWELYFPWQVISGLVSTCLENLKAHCEEQSINPYDSFDFGPSWFPYDS